MSGRRVILLATLVVLGLAGVVFSQDQQKQPLQERFEFIEILLNESSAATQVRDSDIEEAKRLRSQAVEQYGLALLAYESGDNDAATAGLAETVRLINAAVAASQPSGTVTAKDARDFQNRRASVDALLAAHQRIAAERNQQKEHKLLREEITVKLNAANEFFELGDSEQAWRHLNAAYVDVKVAVKQFREGETLIRELKFATKEDEYRYELDRNDSHKMLVHVLLRERLEDERIRERIAPALSSAAELRKLAESQASAGQFVDAVESLEKSTRELVKAIRGAGVYIPG
jgi:hypothetical protein